MVILAGYWVVLVLFSVVESLLFLMLIFGPFFKSLSLLLISCQISFLAGKF